MAITSALVLYAVIWFMVLFISLPIGLRTQGDEDEILEGTHAAAPANLNLRRKFAYVTVISTVVFVVATTVILSGWLSINDIDPLRSVRPVGGTNG